MTRPAGPIRIALGAALLAALGAVLAPASTSADVAPPIRSGWHVLAGPTLGASIHPEHGTGFIGGLEGSLVHLDARDSGLWVGAYTDALFDTGTRVFRASVGPEIGLFLLGLDGGWVIEGGSGGAHQGVTGRLVLTLGAIGVYGRWVHLFDVPREPNIGEVGLLLKIPLVQPYGWRSRPVR